MSGQCASACLALAKIWLIASTKLTSPSGNYSAAGSLHLARCEHSAFPSRPWKLLVIHSTCHQHSRRPPLPFILRCLCIEPDHLAELKYFYPNLREHLVSHLQELAGQLLAIHPKAQRYTTARSHALRRSSLALQPHLRRSAWMHWPRPNGTWTLQPGLAGPPCDSNEPCVVSCCCHKDPPPPPKQKA